MPLLREPTTTSAPTDAFTELTRATSPASPATSIRGQRRGARVRARITHPRLRRARSTAWDIAALRLPAPLLTGPVQPNRPADPALTDGLTGSPTPAVLDPASSPTPADHSSAPAAALANPANPADATAWAKPADLAASAAPMALADQLAPAEPTRMIEPVAPTTPAESPSPEAPQVLPSGPPETVDTAEWEQGQAVRAIDLSDRPKVIITPETDLRSPATNTPSLIESPMLRSAPAKPGSLKPRPAIPTRADFTPSRVFDDVIAPDDGPSTHPGQTQLPDPVQLVTEPSRIPEALLAAVLSVVAILAAWGTAAPSQTWAPLAVLPAVGLIALLLPGADSARLARAGGLLIAAACLPVMSPTMAPVTLVVALAVVVTYPGLVGRWAGRVIVLLAIGALAVPLAIEALADGPGGFGGFAGLTDPSGGLLTGVRLTLGSGILVVALIGSFAMATRRTLTSTASMAIARERTARAATAQASRASGLDHSTGLPNRAALLRSITVALAGSTSRNSTTARNSAHVGLVLVDIDRFADLADSLGATVADDVAEQVAGRLRAEYPGERALARVARHQFAILLSGATSDSCATVARWITVLMAQPIISQGRDLSITCSMGAALIGPGLTTADDLLQAADEACRAAQRSGRARWVMFDQAVRGNAQSQATLEIELREAVQRESIEVAFQPILALGTGDREDRIVGAEALARWTRLDGTVVEPLRFIPMADEIGLGPALGMQVIERALSALVVWRHEGVGVDQVWVNLAPSQLNDPEFAHEVAAQLAIRGLSSSSLVLEISASRLPEAQRPDSEQALSTLGMLRSLGIAVALDDFGRTGTSLSALRRLPISAVKLDQTLAAELGQQDAVPRSVAQLCRTLGLRVVVEGVETVVQLHAAREIGADAVQGFAIARPMSAEDITNLLTLRLPRDFRLR